MSRATPAATGATGKAGKREWIALAMIVLACLLVSMDISILFFAGPFLAVDLAPSGSELLWIMDSYGYLMAGLLITMGSLGDRYGRRRVLLIGAAAFGLTSILAAYSTSPEMLIVARALLGVGGATVAPSTLSLIRTIFTDPDERRAAIGMWTGGFAAGALFGPIAAGILLEHFWWGSTFLINVPVMLLLLVLGPKLLPEFRDPQARGFDLLGAFLSLVAVLPVIYGAKKLAEQEVNATSIGAIVVGVVFGYLFVRRQRSHSNPLMDMELFTNRRFSVAVSVNTVLQFSMLGMMMMTSTFFLVTLDISPFRASLWRLPAVLTLVLGLVIGGLMARKLRPGAIVGIGLGIAALGFLMMSFADQHNGLWVIVVGSSVMTTGVGIVVILATDIILATAPPERAGSAAGLAETSNEFGGALGITVLGSLAGAIYRVGITDDVPPGLPDEASEAIRATVEGGDAVSGMLPAPIGPALGDAVATAYTTGVAWASAAGAALLLVIGIAGAVLLRGMAHVLPGQEDDTAAVEDGTAAGRAEEPTTQRG